MPYLSSAQRAAALAVLGLPEQATGEQILRAYRRLAKATHPDANGLSGPEVVERPVVVIPTDSRARTRGPS